MTNGRKRTAVFWQILLYLTLIALSFSVAGTIVTAMLGLYNHSAADTIAYQRQRITLQKCSRVLTEYDALQHGADYYALSSDYRGLTNFRYEIYMIAPDGEQILLTGNYDANYTINAQAEYSDVYDVYDPYLFSTDLEPSADESETDVWEPAFTETEPYLQSGGLRTTEERIIYGYYCPQYGVIDLYTVMEKVVDLCSVVRYNFPFFLLILAVLCVVIGIFLTRRLWQRSGEPDGGELLLARIPFDLLAVIGFFAILFSIFIIDLINDSFRISSPNLWAIGFLLLNVLALPFLFVLVYSALVVQIQRRQLLSSTIIAWICTHLFLPPLRAIGSVLHKFIDMLPFAWRTAIGVPLTGAVLIFLTCGSYAVGGVYPLLLLTGCLGVYFICLYAAYAIRILLKSGEELSRGNLSYKTDTRRLFSVFRRHAENLNAIGDGMEAAVAEKIKSEHFKTELITNVSHDIKTPLTSIINYADLLSKEELSGKAQEYTEILLRQSARLKKLTEDLVEASKATTGNLPCNPERLSLCQIVRQSLGEYEERLEAAGLQIRTTIPENDLYAMVDGRLLWRVLENLYSNTCKYAMPGTRVYLVVTEDAHDVCISMKNISREPLTVDGEDLTERFVKGDASRSSEGSGLGLNIAKSLVELQHGVFRVTCDGDLFRCDIAFPAVE